MRAERVEPTRPDPDRLLAEAVRQETGRGALKIFLGAAPGVGKTWEMLAQARRRLDAGEDVLAGIIETHGRADTERQLLGLPVLPRRAMDYRGQAMQEFDLDAALARRPALLLVDELAHANVPGSRHAKRWEDVAELIKAGIPVWATLNVQHLESLNDDVARITGVRVAETLPDRALDMADEIELIDLPPEALRARMREGRIYRPDTARRALDGFFKPGNLAALREIAMRRAAQHVDAEVRDWMRRDGIAGPWPVRDALVALVGPDPGAEAVVRHASRLAEALRAPWTALHVERGDSLERARPALDLALRLGGGVETLLADDLVEAAVATARSRNATHFVIGRAPRPRWSLPRRKLGVQMLRRAPDLALHVVPLSAAGPSPPRPATPVAWPEMAGAVAMIAAVTASGLLLRGLVPGEAMGMVYLAAVVATATRCDMRAVLLAAGCGFVAWDFFFLPPLYRITIGSPRDLVAVLVFAAVAVLSGGLAGRVRAQAHAARARVESLRRIAAFGRKLGEPIAEPALMSEIARQGASMAARSVVLNIDETDVRIQAGEPAVDTMDEGAWAAARWTARHGRPSGRGSSTLPSTPWRFLPLQTMRGQLGVLGLRWDHPPDETLIQAASALADQAASALERVRASAEQARLAAFEETNRLRTALLASLGHDLRTPLTGIRGAAGTLRDAWEALDPPTRADLLGCIDEDVRRMTRFLANIVDLTRLESGQVKPRLARVALAQVVDAALARLDKERLIAVALDDPAMAVHADEALLEQVLVNVLENAVKYSPANGLIRISAHVREGRVDIAVADEGVGIPADELPRVFDSFYRAAQGDRVVPGTGLGLAIAKGLLEAMGGEIRLVSPRPDLAADARPGTVVHVAIPA